MNLIDYYKARLGINRDLSQQEAEKVDVLTKGLFLPEDITESDTEKLDSLLEEFGINLRTINVKSLDATIKIISEFKLGIVNLTEEEFLEKTEIISVMLKWHGLSNFSQVTEKELTKLKDVYKAFADKELYQVTYELFDKVRKTNFTELKEISKTSEEQIKQLIVFIKAWGISVSNTSAEIVKTQYLKEIIKILNIERSWLEENNQKKLKVFLNSGDIKKVSDIEEKHVAKAKALIREFNLNFQRLSVLQLKSKLKIFRELKITLKSEVKEIEGTAEFIKQFCKPEDLTSFDAIKIAQIQEVLGIDKRSRNESNEILRIIKQYGVKLSLVEDLEKEVGKINQISGVFKALVEKELKELDSESIKAVIGYLEGFYSNILVLSEEQVQNLGNFLKLFRGDINSIRNSNFGNIKKLFVAFGITIEEKTKLENLAENFKKLKIDIWQLTRAEIDNLAESLGAFFIKPLNSASLEKVGIERLVKVAKEFNKGIKHIGAGYIKKLNALCKTVGKQSVSELELKEIEKLKLVTSSLDIDLEKDQTVTIAAVSDILAGFDLKEAGDNQSTFSKIWSGKEQAVKDKLEEIKQIFSIFGYGNLKEVEDQEKVKFDNVLKAYNKQGSYGLFTVKNALSLNKFLNELGIKFKETSAYRIKQITEGLFNLGVNLFSEAEEHFRKYEVFFKEFGINVAGFDGSKGQKLKSIVSEFGFNIDKSEQEADLFKDILEKLGFSSIEEISLSDVSKIKKLALSIDKEATELSNVISSNLIKAIEAVNINWREAASQDKEIKQLEALKVDLSNTRDTEGRLKLLAYIPQVYKHKCSGKEESLEKMSIQDIKAKEPDNFEKMLQVYEGNPDCITEIDQGDITEMCREYFKELDETIVGLCKAPIKSDL